MKKTIQLFGFVLLCCMMILPVSAKSDNMFGSNEIKINQNINKSIFAGGKNIEVTSEINGANFAAGNNVFLSSTQDYIFAAGNTINLENSTAKDAFIAGNSINIQSSNIRDLYAAGRSIRLDSNLEGDAYIAGESITINAKVNGDVRVTCENITLGKDAVITGELEYPDNANIHILEGASIGSKKTYHMDTDLEKNKSSLKETFTSKVYAYLSITIIALLLLLLWKKPFQKLEKLELSGKSVAKTTGKGFLFLIALPIVAIILMITIVGFPLGLISILLYGLGIYLSTITTAYYLGRLGLRNKIPGDYSYLAICILILFLLRLIPYVGPIVNVFSICLGLGLFLELFKKEEPSKSKKK